MAKRFSAAVRPFSRLGIEAPGTKQVFYGLCLLVVVMALPDGVWPWLKKKLGLSERKS